MISAVAGGLVDLVQRPLLIVPTLLSIATNFAIMLLSLDSYTNILFSTVLFGEVPDVPLLELPFYFFTSYAWDIAVIALALFASIAFGVFMVFVYSKMVAGKIQGNEGKAPGTVEAIGFALSKWPEAISLSAVCFAAGIIYLAVAFVLFGASVSGDGLAPLAGALLLITWLAFGVYACIKLAFAPLFISIEGKGTKEGLSGSWSATSGKLTHVAAFLFVSWVVAGALFGVFSFAGDLIKIEEASFALTLLGACISGAFYNTALVRFFVVDVVK